jgi:hypothetical protein
MANEAFEAAISSTDFDPEVYDNDGNGYVCGANYRSLVSKTNKRQVDAFVVVHAGRGAEQTGDMLDLWSVKWTLPKEREAEGEYYEDPSCPCDLQVARCQGLWLHDCARGCQLRCLRSRAWSSR